MVSPRSSVSRACRSAGNFGPTYRAPRRPFEKERIDAELKLCGEFGLRNKREIWRVNYILSKVRSVARELLTLDPKVRFPSVVALFFIQTCRKEHGEQSS